MNLLELAKQYRSDVETRIECLTDELLSTIDEYGLDENDSVQIDIDEQIKHWNKTLHQINEVIRETEKN